MAHRRSPAWRLQVGAVAVLAGLAVWLAATAVIARGRPDPRTHTATPPLRSLSVDDTIKALAEAGVGVYTSPTSRHPLDPISAPATPLRMLLSQVDADAAQIDAGTGTSAADLDALVPMPAHAPPFAYLLAAYAKGTSTPGEKLAGRLLGSAALANPQTAVFPTLVQTLFAADAARAALTRSSKHHGRVGVSPPPATAARTVGETCATIADWASSAADRFFNALTVGTPSNAGLAFITGIWNRAVASASAAISGISATLTSQLTSFIRNGLATVGVASMAISTLQNLRLKITATPASNRFSLTGQGAITGDVKATLGGPTHLDYPSGLTDCAKAFKLDLPSLNDVSDDAVTWATQSTGSGTVLATVTSKDDKLGHDHSATLAYTTSEESPDQAARGTLITSDFYRVSVTVDPAVFKKLLDLVEGLTLGRVPGGSTVAGPIVRSLKSAVLKQIATLAQPSDVRYVEIEHHGTPPALASGVTCDHLLPISDFPGASVLVGPINESLGGVWESGCTFTNCHTADCSSGNTGGSDNLFTFQDNAAAVVHYNGVCAKSPNLPGFGDAACSDPSLLTMRVANDVFSLEQGQGDPPPSELTTVAAELCPDCRYPTAGS